MLCGGALPGGDRAHACWRVHGSGNVVQQVVREVKRGAERQEKNQGEAKRDESADSLVVESASADPIQRLPSVPGSAKRNGAINYHGGDGAALQLQHLE